MLCQQDLDHAARHRLETFEAFVASTAEHELREVRDAWVERRSTFTDLEVIPEHVKEILAEVRIEHEALSDAIAAALAAAENRRRTVSLALREDGELAENCPDLKPVAAEVDALATQMLDRVAALQARVTPESQENMTYEAQEFRARKVLAQHEGIVLDEIERKRKYAAYELCLSTAFRKYTNVLKLNSTHTYDMLRHLGAMHASNQPLSHHARPRGGVRIAAAGHQIYVALLSSGPGQDDPARRTGAA